MYFVRLLFNISYDFLVILHRFLVTKNYGYEQLHCNVTILLLLIITIGYEL